MRRYARNLFAFAALLACLAVAAVGVAPPDDHVAGVHALVATADGAELNAPRLRPVPQFVADSTRSRERPAAVGADDRNDPLSGARADGASPAPAVALGRTTLGVLLEPRGDALASPGASHSFAVAARPTTEAPAPARGPRPLGNDRRAAGLARRVDASRQVDSVVFFEVAVRAEQREALGVRHDLGDLRVPAALRPLGLLARVPVVELERALASGVPAPLARAAPLFHHFEALPPSRSHRVHT